MSQLTDLIEQAKAMGAIFDVTTEGVKVRRPRGPLPADTLATLKKHKDEIRAELIKPRYRPLFPDLDQRAAEMEELVHRVEEEGYVLLWSNVLQDLVAYHRDDVDPATIPAGFVPYAEEELRHLFPEDDHATCDYSENALRFIHAAKTTGAQISGRKEE